MLVALQLSSDEALVVVILIIWVSALGSVAVARYKTVMGGDLGCVSALDPLALGR